MSFSNIARYDGEGIVFATGSLDYLAIQIIPSGLEQLTFYGESSETVQLKNIKNPVANQDAATKNYVDNLVNGVSWKQPVFVKNGPSISINTVSPGASIDGILPYSGARILLTDQSNAVQNGIYNWYTIDTPLIRAPDFPTGGDLVDYSASAIFVQTGAVYGDTAWVETTDTGFIGTDPNNWVQFASGNGGAAGAQYDVQFRGTNPGEFAATNNFQYLTTTDRLTLTNAGIEINETGLLEINCQSAPTITSGGDIYMYGGPTNTIYIGGSFFGGGLLALGASDGTCGIYTNTVTVSNLININSDGLILKSGLITSSGALDITSTDTSGEIRIGTGIITADISIGPSLDDNSIVLGNKDTKIFFEMVMYPTSSEAILSTTNGLKIITPNMISSPVLNMYTNSTNCFIECNTTLNIQFNANNSDLNMGKDITTGVINIGQDLTSGGGVVLGNEVTPCYIRLDTTFEKTKIVSTNGLSVYDTTESSELNIFNNTNGCYIVSTTSVDITSSNSSANIRIGSTITFGDIHIGPDVNGGNVYLGNQSLGTYINIDPENNKTFSINVDGTHFTHNMITFLILKTDIGNGYITCSTNMIIDTSDTNASLYAGRGIETGTIHIGENLTTGNMYLGSTGLDHSVYVLGTKASTSKTTGAFIVDGGVGITGDVYATQFIASSDKNLKTNINLLDPEKSLNNILSINGYSYNWKDTKHSKNLEFGVIAQELEEIGLSNLVFGSDEKSVNYLGIIPLLIQSIKHLNSKIKILEDKLL